MKQCFLLIVLLLFCSPVTAQTEVDSSDSDQAIKKSKAGEKQDVDEDPIATKLEAAKFAYIGEVTTAYETLLGSIDSAIEKAENDSSKSVEYQLKTLKGLTSARKKFVADADNLPKLSSLKSATRKYTRQLSDAKKALNKEFDNAADQYRKPPLKNFAAAAKTLADQKAFFKDVGKPSARLSDGEVSEFSPKYDGKNWKASDPNSVNPENGNLVVSAGSKGNYFLTRKIDFIKPDVTTKLSASAGTEAYLIINARRKDGSWRGVTTKIQFENGKILTGGHSFEFKFPDSIRNTEDGKPAKFDVGEDFELRLRVSDKPEMPGRLRIKSYLNTKTSKYVHYPRTKVGESGAVGFYVKKGEITIKKFVVEK